MILKQLIMPVKDTEQSVWFESPRQSLAGVRLMYKSLTEDEFLSRCCNMHNNFYDYTLCNYRRVRDKITIICPNHGVFEQRADAHVSGAGCPQCSFIRSDTKEFIQKAKRIHGDYYDYSQSEYVKWDIKVKIICPEHGIFNQSPNGHLSGKGCAKCAIKRSVVKMSSTIKEFVDRAIKIHGDKYDYSQVGYVNAREKVKIICKEHGMFLQVPYSHLAGNGCAKCGDKSISNKLRIGLDEFIRRANNVHLDKYDYSKVVYSGMGNKVEIICPQHGRFYQNAINHLLGCDCPKCKNSSGENFISRVLELNNVEYKMQKTFPACLINRKMKFDFYLSDYNILIEYQGLQHFRVTEWWGGLKSYMIIKRNDEYKKRWAMENGYIFKEYTYGDSWDYIKRDLLKTIRKCQRLVS